MKPPLRLHRHDLLGAPGRSADDAEQRDAKTEMRQHRAESRARQASRTRQCGGKRQAQQTGALDEIGHRPGHDEGGKPDAERRQHRTATGHGKGRRYHDERERRRADQRCATPSRSPRFQGISGPSGTTSNSGTNSGPKVRLKNGAPTEIFSPSGFERERVERASEHARRPRSGTDC